MTKKELYANIKVAVNLAKTDPDFEESSVREEIISPIIKQLGYKPEDIKREKRLQDPILTTGSSRGTHISLVPDYLLMIEDRVAVVIDAKSPSEKVNSRENVAQAYSYSVHREVGSKYFALCNGIDFALYRTHSPDKPALILSLDNIEKEWDNLYNLISPHSFQAGKEFKFTNYESTKFEYATRPLLDEIPVRKQEAKRHFGCNAYFTRQTWNVVQEYIKNFTQEGDIVLDPFGGSGVTAIEALMIKRKAIHIDLNPLSIFMVEALTFPTIISEITEVFTKIKEQYLQRVPKTAETQKQAMKKLKLPKGLDLPLPQNSDVPTVKDLFSERQIVELALLKQLILEVKNEGVRKSMMLAFYNTVTVCNLTFHETPQRKGLGGHHFGFYYRYRMAYEPIELPVIDVFEKKLKRIINGKQEMTYFINENTIRNIDIRKGTATDLSHIPKESVDYIYTDPPYGKKIAYLDLSAMWNAWLDLEVTEADFKQEAIEGGEYEKTKEEYKEMIAQSIREMYRVLKFDRWLSFVFAHKDPEFWHLIIETAEQCGFEYAGAVPQKNGQTSFKKRQHPFTVLSGQLIINFRKVRTPRAILRANLGMDIGEIVHNTIESVIAKHQGATLEQINNELIIKGLELSFLHELKAQYSDLSEVLGEYEYHSDTGIFTIKEGRKFRTNVPDHLKIKFFTMSYLREMERKGINPTLEDIVFKIMPSLRNGSTPEEQTILGVLETIAIKVGEGRWRIKGSMQTSLFDPEYLGTTPSE